MLERGYLRFKKPVLPMNQMEELSESFTMSCQSKLTHIFVGVLSSPSHTLPHVFSQTRPFQNVTSTMADADEDAFPLSSHAASSSTSRTQQAPDTDPTDEAQDFRFLSSVNSRPSAASPNSPDPAAEFTIPRRGEKDFEPLPFLSSQTAALDASRAAMQTALSVPRVHSGKSHLVGVFVGEAPKGLRGRRGVEGRCVCVKLFRGPLARTIGMGDARNRTWLWPEEALFLVERGSLDVRWPRNGGG